MNHAACKPLSDWNYLLYVDLTCGLKIGNEKSNNI